MAIPLVSGGVEGLVFPTSFEQTNAPWNLLRLSTNGDPTDCQLTVHRPYIANKSAQGDWG